MARPTHITLDDMDVKKRPQALTAPVPSPARNFPRRDPPKRHVRPVRQASSGLNDAQLTLRLPTDTVMAIKQAALDARLSISAYMLACHHAHKKAR